jgi:hypothetical protein
LTSRAEHLQLKILCEANIGSGPWRGFGKTLFELVLSQFVESFASMVSRHSVHPDTGTLSNLAASSQIQPGLCPQTNAVRSEH